MEPGQDRFGRECRSRFEHGRVQFVVIHGHRGSFWIDNPNQFDAAREVLVGLGPQSGFAI